MSRSIVRSKINAKYNPVTTGGGGGGSAIAVYDEGSLLTVNATSFNFTGAGVTASAVGDAVTVNIPGGGSSSPALPDSSIQFNEGGAFGGDSQFTYQYDTSLLSSKHSVSLDCDYNFNTDPLIYPGAAGIKVKNSSTGTSGEVRYPFITSHAVDFVSSAPTIVMKINPVISGNLRITGFKCDYSIDGRHNTIQYHTSRAGTLLTAFHYPQTTEVNLVDSFIVADNSEAGLDLNVGKFYINWDISDTVELYADFSSITTADTLFFNGLFTVFMVKPSST